jgi:hypothetical protein
MSHALLKDPMSKKRTPGPKEGEAGGERPAKTTTTTKLPSELLRRAKTVAAYRGIDLYDYLVEALSPTVNKDYGGIVRESE